MVWNRKLKQEKQTDWIEKFESEADGDPSLKMASELRRVRLSTLRTPEEFRAALRDNLLDRHRLYHDQTGRGNGLLASSGVRLIGVTWIVAAILAIGMRHTWQLYLSSKIDGWAYTPPPDYYARYPSISTDFHRWFIGMLSALDGWKLPIMRGGLLLFGALFAVALLFRVVYTLRSRRRPERVAPAYWRSIASRAMWLSASTAVVLLVLTMMIPNRQGDQVSMLTTTDMAAMQLDKRTYPNVHLASQNMQMASQRMGLAVGGAMDANNFRENIDNGYLPLPTDITYEGLFNEYYFDTGESLVDELMACDQLFCPTYALAQSSNPLSEEMETFLSVGLTSGMAEADFARKSLNLVVVIDVSGSMDEPFHRYYYDNEAASNSAQSDKDVTTPKAEVAGIAVTAMLDHLEADDRLGIVLFNEDAEMAKSLRTMDESDVNDLRDHLDALTATGGTNLESGYRLATELLDEVTEADPAQYENRIIVLTDAQPNLGELGRGDLASMTAGNADSGIYTTFVGVGVDFNTDLIESITKMEGANYYSVHAPDEFVRRLDEGFDYMVTPLVFDLRLHFDSADARIDTVYGSPEADASTGELMHVNTLFPSMREDGEVKGGIVLLKLARDGDAATKATLTATYRDRSGQEHNNQVAIAIPPLDAESHFDHSGIRKGVLLARYAELLKAWLGDARGEASGRVAESPNQRIGSWERTSTALNVPKDNRSRFIEFTEYFEAEMETIDDETLQQELDLLHDLAE